MAAQQQLEDILAIPAESAILASAKEGIGIEEILEAIVARDSAAEDDRATPLQALGFDSYLTPTRAWSRMCVCSTGAKAGMHVKLLHGKKRDMRSRKSAASTRNAVREKLEVGETGISPRTSKPEAK